MPLLLLVGYGHTTGNIQATTLDAPADHKSVARSQPPPPPRLDAAARVPALAQAPGRPPSAQEEQ